MKNSVIIAEALNKRITSEGDLQKTCARIFDIMGLCWMHSPNEGRRSPRFGARLKAEGMKRGFPDIIIFDYMLAIELKFGRNKLTPEQYNWLMNLEELGWYTAVCYSVQEVLDVLVDVNEE